jgi:alpha-mannosidase
LFGKFVTVDEFFSQTDTSGRFSKLAPDDYQTPYLAQAVRRGDTDPISSHVRRQRDDVSRMGAGGTALLHAALTLGSPGSADLERDDGPPNPALIAEVLARGGDNSRRGTLWLNPFSFPCVAVGGLDSDPAVAGPKSSVEVPGMGFAWVDAQASIETPAKKKAPRPIASELTLVNEHFEIHIHPETGGIGALRNNRARGNRLSQQLAFHIDRGTRRAADDASDYSTMVADTIEVAISDPAVGEIVSRGRLVGDYDRLLARYEQAVRVVRGSRIVEITIRLEIDELPSPEPWKSYYASRWAWPDETADLRRSITGTSQPTEARRLEAPQFIEIQGDRTRTTILTGGLPYHRRAGDRMLDSLLVVRGEQAREFRMGIGVDLASPAAAALMILGAEPVAANRIARPRSHESGWLFRLDRQNIVATHWEPLVVTDAASPDAGRVTGFRVRILGTEGQSGRAQLNSFRPIRAARQVDLLGQPLVELRLVDEAVSLDFGAYEWMQVEVEWREGPA